MRPSFVADQLPQFVVFLDDLRQHLVIGEHAIVRDHFHDGRSVRVLNHIPFVVFTDRLARQPPSFSIHLVS